MFTQEEINYIKANHGKITIATIAKHLNKNYSTVRSKAQDMGLFRDKSLNPLPNKYTHNMEYFKYPNIENCYMAGLIATDGCIRKITKRKNGYIFSYNISIKDESIIDNFIKFLNFTGNKIYHWNKSPNSENYYKQVRIDINGFAKNAEFLKENFNIVPQKTFRLGPTNINNKYLNYAFIQGLYDGDGYIGLRDLSKNKQKYQRLAMTLVSASKPLLQWVKNIFDIDFNYLNCNRRQTANIVDAKTDRSSRISISGLRAAIIIDYLRQFPAIPRLARKWDKPEVLQYIDQNKKERPELFKTLDINEIRHLLPPEHPDYQPLISLKSPENNNSLEISPEFSIIN